MAKRRLGRHPKEFRRMAVERLKTCDNIVELSEELGVHRRLLYKWRDQLEPLDRERNHRREAGIHTPEGNQPIEAGAGGQNAGARFFQRCLAKSRGSTPEQRYDWREGIYDEIQELMPLQDSLSIERMCQLAGVSRAGFYRLCRAELRRGRHGYAERDSADRFRASTPIRLSTD